MARPYPSISEATREPFFSTPVSSGQVGRPSGLPAASTAVEAVEVTVAWGDAVIAVLHHAPPRAVTLGEVDAFGRPCDVLLPKERLGFDCLPLVSVADGTVTIQIPGSAEGFVDDGQGSRTALERLRLEAKASDRLAGAVEHTLRCGETISYRIGLFVFIVRSNVATRRQPYGLLERLDQGFLRTLALTALVMGAWMGTLAYHVPASGMVEDAALDEDQLRVIQQYLMANAERNVKLEEQAAVDEANRGEKNGNAGSRSPGEAGKMGSTVSRRTSGKMGVSGPRDNPAPHLGRSELIEQARNFGMVELLGSLNANSSRGMSSPWGQGVASGRDALDAMGALYGRDIGDSAGMGGLTLSGTGQGGGCVGPRCGSGVGIGDIGTLGGGTGVCPPNDPNCDGMGRGIGRLGQGRHRDRVPRMRVDGTTTVSGRLPPEVIQRVVRQNYGRFRACYEQALARNPSLEGRVVTRFVIGRDGAVANVQSGGSDFPDATAQSCIAQQFYGLSFPAPEGGVVTVTYPLYLQPG